MTRGVVGRTRLSTRRERHRRTALVVLSLLLGVAATATAGAIIGWLTGAPPLPELMTRPLVTGGNGGLLGLPAPDRPAGERARVQFPITVVWPTHRHAVAVIAVVLWAALTVVVTRPLRRSLSAEPRHDGLASLPEIRRAFGRAAVRRTTQHTLPGMSVWRRWLLPTSACGYRLGRPAQPRARWTVWADWEQRIRIIGRPGWGKTTRLLIPIIRQLPGPALVSSTEPLIFAATIAARQRPARRTRWRLTDAVLDRLRPRPPRPIAVADFSDPAHRWAAGYPQVRWSPIPDCQDYVVAHRRATALMSGAGRDSMSGRDSENDEFFRRSASDVLAAWLHAAALESKSLDHLARWLTDPTDPTPTRVLEDHRDAEPSAALHLAKHLDRRAAKTTSGVERYLTLATSALLSAEGRTFCEGTKGTVTATQDAGGLDEIIAANGTIYLLADVARVDRVRPLLGLFAAEMFLAAEQLALRQPSARLCLPFIAVLDELRHGIAPPNLGYVAAAQRKHGIGLVYAVQSATQEDAAYGRDAQALRDAAGVTLVGGIDITTAEELSDRAGTTTVVTPSRSDDRHSEQLAQLPALSVADQQRLTDGRAVVAARGLAPFTMSVPAVRRRRHGKAVARNATRLSCGNVAIRRATRLDHAHDVRRRARGQ